MATTLPGLPTESEEAERVFNSLVERFRQSGKSDVNRPLWSDFTQIGDLFWGRVFDTSWISAEAQVWFIEETGLMQRPPQEVRRCNMREVRDYLSQREEWEFADTYILSANMDWCLVVTHDDECKIAKPTKPTPG